MSSGQLKITDLNKSYKSNRALKEIDISFENGVYGLLGPNGAGKTTLLKCLVRIYAQGNIQYNDCCIDEKFVKKHIGYLPQNFGAIPELTTYEMLELICLMKKIPKKSIPSQVRNALEMVNLENMKNTKIGKLSGGMIQRIGIAQTFLGNPKVLIFDEPTNGLDPEERMRFRSIISRVQEKQIVIISTHLVEDVLEMCNHIIVLNHGEIKCNQRTEDLMSNDNLFVYMIEEDEMSNINGEFEVLNTVEKYGKKYIRIVTKKQQQLKQDIINIEDIYLCALKNYYLE